MNRNLVNLVDSEDKEDNEAQKSLVIGGTVVSSGSGQFIGGNIVDIVFVFDTTGSMDDKISALLLTCTSFVDETNKMNLNPQFTLISFGDLSVPYGGDKIEVVVPPTSDIEIIKNGLRYIPRNKGFGNNGESVLEAIDMAFNIQYRDEAVKVMLVVTDEPAHNVEAKVGRIIATMKDRGFLVFVVATDEFYYHAMAEKNGGFWWEIGPDTKLDEILKRFREMARKVSLVVDDVYRLGEGDVKTYLLNAPK